MTTFFCYIVSIFLFILFKRTMIQYPNFMRQHTIGMMCDHIFFFCLYFYQRLLYHSCHVRILKEEYGVLVVALTIFGIFVILIRFIYLPNHILCVRSKISNLQLCVRSQISNLTITNYQHPIFLSSPISIFIVCSITDFKFAIGNFSCSFMNFILMSCKFFIFNFSNLFCPVLSFMYFYFHKTFNIFSLNE